MHNVTRRTVLSRIPLAIAMASGVSLAGPAHSALASRNAEGAGAEAYGAFRLVRETPGTPAEPEISLPDGYQVVDGSEHSVASRAEYYTFIVGQPAPEGIRVEVRWPGVKVAAVINGDEHLAMEPDGDDPDAFGFTLPVDASSVGGTQSTLQIWSHLNTQPGIDWRIEHNDPDRVAGPWLEVDWPAGQVAAVVHYLVASEAILIDSGVAEVAADKGHFYALMGFETNNTLHPDNPPHWHLAYYAGSDFSAPAYLPHFWFDEEGRNFYNGQDVTGQGRTEYRAGDPAPMYDFADNLVLTQTIRSDGGLDIDPPDGPRYSIVPGSDGTFVQELVVVRDGQDWLRIATVDRVREGVMQFDVEDLTDGNGSEQIEYHYDRLTGVLKDE